MQKNIFLKILFWKCLCCGSCSIINLRSWAEFWHDLWCFWRKFWHFSGSCMGEGRRTFPKVQATFFLPCHGPKIYRGGITPPRYHVTHRDIHLKEATVLLKNKKIKNKKLKTKFNDKISVNQFIFLKFSQGDRQGKWHVFAFLVGEFRDRVQGIRNLLCEWRWLSWAVSAPRRLWTDVPESFVDGH